MSEHKEKFSRRADTEIKKAAEHLEKDGDSAKDAADSWAKQACQGIHKVSASVSAGICSTLKCARCVTAATLAKTHSLALRSFQELQNPVVLLNVLLGSGAVCGLLSGYARYDARYLKGKSDGAVLATVGGVTALLAADVLLSAKFYKKCGK